MHRLQEVKFWGGVPSDMQREAFLNNALPLFMAVIKAAPWTIELFFTLFTNSPRICFYGSYE